MRLYVGNLSYSTGEQEVESLFSTHGAIESVKLIRDQMTGQSRGFGFVEMPNDEEAIAAMEKLNGSDFGGRKLTINEARPMEARPRTGGFGGGGDRGGRGGDRGGRGGGGGGYGDKW